MAFDYDQLYRTEANALGAPNKALLAAFETHLTPPARVLDVGCGQGRDALPVGRLGHAVVGVDLSPAGIADLCAAGEAEGLAITGDAADITTYEPEGSFDALLFDRTLHMLDPEPRHATLARLVTHLRPGGVLFLLDEPGNMAGLRAVLDAAGCDWHVLEVSKSTLILRRG